MTMLGSSEGFQSVMDVNEVTVEHLPQSCGVVVFGVRGNCVRDGGRRGRRVIREDNVKLVRGHANQK